MQKPSRDALLLAACAGIALLALSWLYPPRTATIDASPGIFHRNADFWPAWGPDQVWSDNRTFHLDLGTLLMIDLAIATITASAIFSIQFERK